MTNGVNIDSNKQSENSQFKIMIVVGVFQYQLNYNLIRLLTLLMID